MIVTKNFRINLILFSEKVKVKRILQDTRMQSEGRLKQNFRQERCRAVTKPAQKMTFYRNPGVSETAESIAKLTELFNNSAKFVIKFIGSFRVCACMNKY